MTARGRDDAQQGRHPRSQRCDRPGTGQVAQHALLVRLARCCPCEEGEENGRGVRWGQGGRWEGGRPYGLLEDIGGTREEEPQRVGQAGGGRRAGAVEGRRHRLARICAIPAGAIEGCVEPLGGGGAREGTPKRGDRPHAGLPPCARPARGVPRTVQPKRTRQSDGYWAAAPGQGRGPGRPGGDGDGEPPGAWGRPGGARRPDPRGHRHHRSSGRRRSRRGPQESQHAYRRGPGEGGGARGAGETPTAGPSPGHVRPQAGGGPDAPRRGPRQVRSLQKCSVADSHGS